MKFLSPEVALCLYKSTIRPCTEYSCHFWAGAPNCYLDMLDKLQKRVCRTVVSTFAASLEPLGHRRHNASLNLFSMYCCSRRSSELAKLVPLPYSCWRSTRYSDWLHNFLLAFLDVNVCVDNFFPRTAVARRCSVKEVLVKISQNLQENSCARLSFLIKLQVEACNFIKK